MKISRFVIVSSIVLIFINGQFALGASDPLRKMAKELTKSLKKLKDPRIGILAFPHHNGGISSGSSIVSERLTTYLASMAGIKVVERRLITKMLEEQRLNETGVIDQNSAQEIGKVLGINVIVTGTLIDLGDDKVEVNARGIESASGSVVAASQAKIARTWLDKPKRPGPRPLDTAAEEHAPEVTPAQNDPIEVGIPAPSRGRSYPGWGRRKY